nr:MAG TPA: hypothetical protein [Bacteriophage sp.]
MRKKAARFPHSKAVAFEHGNVPQKYDILYIDYHVYLRRSNICLFGSANKFCFYVQPIFPLLPTCDIIENHTSEVFEWIFLLTSPDR